MCRLFLMTIACLLILFGISGFYMMPKIIQQKIEQRVQLKLNTKTYKRFTDIPIPLTVKFYLFNVTNSEQVLLGLERPNFQEVGPFMYKQWRKRVVTDFEDYNRRIVYREVKTFYPMYTHEEATTTTTTRYTSNGDTNYINFNNSADNGSFGASSSSADREQQVSEPRLLDPHNFNITMVNLPLLSVLTKLAQLEEGSLKRKLAAKVAGRLIKDGRDKILVTRLANEILFDGYKVNFMESARDLVSNTFGFNFESPLPGNKFGFFYTKNGTWNRKENGELTVITGRNQSMKDFMMVDNWNGLKKLNVWHKDTGAGETCNEIKGTDGSQFHPGVDKNQVLEIFSPLVCRSLHIKYVEDTQVNDIPLLRYTTPAELFAAPRKNPKNACFCTVAQKQSTSSNLTPRINDSRCYLDGLMDLSLCRGAPIAASSPHFYNADPMLAMSAGLKPNKELHETYIDIEPMTGSVFRAASRGQLNAYVEQAALDVVDSDIIGKMSAMVAPLMWFEEAASIDDKSSIEFKSQLLNLVQKARSSFRYSIIIGIILAIVVGAQFWYSTFYSAGARQAASSKRPAVSKKERARSSRRQFEANIRLASGARKSNLANKNKNVLSDVSIDNPDQADDNNTGRRAANRRRPRVLPRALVMATALGAASAGPSNSRKGHGASSPNDEIDESKKVLVANEWNSGVNTNTDSSGRSSRGADAETSREAVDSDPEAIRSDAEETDLRPYQDIRRMSGLEESL